MPDVAPAPVLAVLVGLFHTGVYLMLRGAAGLRLAFVGLAAILGAYAGQALGARLGDPLSIGDFGLLWASLLAWLGIVLIAAASFVASSSAR
ncbi:MAG TPA: hypothetical protein VJK49_04495 [Candidatus Limnocylindrales bacterium]|nr:hypothetical protein [Candidatus Limnocylindrales bacterium]